MTGVVLKNPDDDRSLTETEYGLPLVEVQSSTQSEAEKMADALNYLLKMNQPLAIEEEVKENFWESGS